MRARLAAALLFACVLDGMDMRDMDTGGMDMPVHGVLGRYGMSREASGTSWQPEAAPHSGSI